MKRESQQSPIPALPTYSLWPLWEWNFCVKCKKEFRREKGYSVFTQIGGNVLRGERIVCGSCAGSPAEAADICLQHIRDNRLPPPPN